MRILLINRDLGSVLGCEAAFDRAVAQSLSASGHEVELLGRAPLFSSSGSKGPPHASYLRLPKQLFQRAALHWVLAASRASHFDVIQCCNLFKLSADLLSRTHLGVVAWLPHEPPPTAQIAIRQLIKCERFGLFTYGTAAKFLSDRMALDEFTDFEVIPPGISPRPRRKDRFGVAAFRAKHNIPETETIGVTVAPQLPTADLSFLIQAVSQVNDKTPLHWLVASNGSIDAALQRGVASAGLANRIHFFDRQSASQNSELLAAADLFAFPGDAQNDPAPLLEALSHGLPVVVRPMGGAPELVEQSGAGLVSSASAEPSFAECLLRLSLRPELRLQLGRKAHQFAATRTWDRTANLLLNLYRKTVPESDEVVYRAGRA